VELDDVLEVELLAPESDCVVPVPVEESVPVDDVVEVVSEPPALVALLSAGWLGAAPPRPSGVEIPPVARVVTLTVIVVVVVCGGVICDAEDVEGSWVEPVGLLASWACVAWLTAGVDAAGAEALVSAAATETEWMTGGRGGATWVTRA
jgi:hypothetical protein